MKNKKIRNTMELIEFISKPMRKEDVLVLYRVNNVIPEKAELYLDFIQSLYNTVSSTYLGEDYLDEMDIKKHFNWCWNKVVTDFKKEHIYFEDNVEIYSYFSSLFTESFYEEEDEELMDFWSTTFSYNLNKTRSELETFFDLYKLFDKSVHV